MKQRQNSIVIEVCEQPEPVISGKRAISIGLPKSANLSERRFPFTPEGVAQLVERGFVVRLESGAGSTIHYTDAAYARAGAIVCSREETLSADIVVSLPVLLPADINKIKRGAMLLTLYGGARFDGVIVRELLRRNIITVALDLFADSNGCRPIADLLAEIDGCAAVSRASSLLADSTHGKGILLGGIAGVVPCEILVIGSNLAACSAARSGLGLGAIVRMMDTDVYRLREARRELGDRCIITSLQPRAVESALRTADVIVYAGVNNKFVIDSDMVSYTKRGVIVFDLSCEVGKAFPSLRQINLASSRPVDISPTEPSRVCYVNAGSLVPRTAAMGLSDALLCMFSEIHSCEGLTNALKLMPGLQCAALTFLGKPVHPHMAELAGVRQVDINIYLTLS